METVVMILIAQGILGGFDVLRHHEWQEHLPQKQEAALEQKIHGSRELLYSIVFLGLSWFAWHGVWAWLLAAVIIIEILLTGWDFVIEDQTRRLSASERLTHLVLSMTGGAYVGFLIPVIYTWSLYPSQLLSTQYGFHSWLLSGFGLGVFVWGVRDLWCGWSLSATKNNSTFGTTYGH